MTCEPEIFRQVYRTDALIGCGNLLSFAELLIDHFKQEHPPPLSLLSLDVNAFSEVNAQRGHVGGDAALRWIGIVLEEETRTQVFRVGGDELACVFKTESLDEHAASAQRIFEHLNRDALKFGLGIPAATISVIHYPENGHVDPAEVFVHLSAAILDVKKRGNKSFKVFHARDLALSEEQVHLRWLAQGMIDSMVSLGAMLDVSNRLAYTDPVTGLPNMRAAQQRLETALAQAITLNQPVSVLLVDGDDLRKYNQISYAAGDGMIQRLGDILASKLRPGDFLARWRVGDEFLIILPGTPLERAGQVGERLCRAVTENSQSWPIAVTVSIGIAGSPPSATPAALLDGAEMANKRAKDLGKNQVWVWTQTT